MPTKAKLKSFVLAHLVTAVDQFLREQPVPTSKHETMLRDGVECMLDIAKASDHRQENYYRGLTRTFVTRSERNANAQHVSNVRDECRTLAAQVGLTIKETRFGHDLFNGDTYVANCITAVALRRAIKQFSKLYPPQPKGVAT